MGTKKKNSNYVTEKTIKAKEDALKAKKAKETKKKITYIIVYVLIALCLIAGIVLIAINTNIHDHDHDHDSEHDSEQENNSDTDEKVEEPANTTVTNRASIEIEGYGTIELDLYGEEAPETVANFVKLANEGFYDGLTFHRIMDNFMIQGGCPKGNGTGGYEVDGVEQNIKGEFSANNVKNNIKHVRGTISMAREGNNMDSASSQFFIVHQTSASNSASLDGKYAAFGMVTSGMEIVDQICNDVIEGNNGSVNKADQPVIKSITIHE